jgi:hypothetical protein
MAHIRIAMIISLELMDGVEFAIPMQNLEKKVFAIVLRKIH